MIPTPVPPIVEVAPVAIAVPPTQWFQLFLGGMTAISAVSAAVAAVMGLFHLQRIHIQFNSVFHELMTAREGQARAQGAAQGASDERDRLKVDASDERSRVKSDASEERERVKAEAENK